MKKTVNTSKLFLVAGFMGLGSIPFLLAAGDNVVISLIATGGAFFLYFKSR